MSNMRWSKKDRQLLLDYEEKWNRKVDRLHKDKNFDKDYIPEKVDVYDIFKRISSREDYKNELGILKAFTKRNSQKIVEKSTRGAKIPQFMIDINTIKIKKINKDRKKQRKLYENEPKTDRGKKISKNNFSNAELDHLNEMNVNYKNKSKADILALNSTLKEYNISVDKKNKTYVDNYKKGIETIFSNDDMERIKKVLDKVSDETILKMLYTDKSLVLDFVYEDLIDYDIRLESVLEGWERVAKKEKKQKVKRKKK